MKTPFGGKNYNINLAHLANTENIKEFMTSSPTPWKEEKQFKQNHHPQSSQLQGHEQITSENSRTIQTKKVNLDKNM